MRATNSMLLILLLALAIASSNNNIVRQCGASSAAADQDPFLESKRQHPGRKWSVTIFNHLNKDGPNLNVHCKSKNDDLGEHVLQNFGSSYTWNFKENFWGTTLFWCHFRSKRAVATYEVFWPEKGTWLAERCDFGTCRWYVGDDGFYLENIPLHKKEIVNPWQAPSS